MLYFFNLMLTVNLNYRGAYTCILNGTNTVKLSFVLLSVYIGVALEYNKPPSTSYIISVTEPDFSED